MISRGLILSRGQPPTSGKLKSQIAVAKERGPCERDIENYLCACLATLCGSSLDTQSYRHSTLPLALDGVGISNCPQRSFCSSQSLTTTKGRDVVVLIAVCYAGLLARYVGGDRDCFPHESGRFVTRDGGKSTTPLYLSGTLFYVSNQMSKVKPTTCLYRKS